MIFLMLHYVNTESLSTHRCRSCGTDGSEDWTLFGAGTMSPVVFIAGLPCVILYLFVEKFVL